MRPQRFTYLRLLEAEEHRSGFDDVHPAAKAGEGLSELDADGPASEDCERHWQLSWNRGLTVRPEVDRVEAGDRWDRRGAAVGDHHGAACHQLLASHPDRARIRQCS